MIIVKSIPISLLRRGQAIPLIEDSIVRRLESLRFRATRAIGDRLQKSFSSDNLSSFLCHMKATSLVFRLRLLRVLVLFTGYSVLFTKILDSSTILPHSSTAQWDILHDYWNHPQK